MSPSRPSCAGRGWPATWSGTSRRCASRRRWPPRTGSGSTCTPTTPSWPRSSPRGRTICEAKRCVTTCASRLPPRDRWCASEGASCWWSSARRRARTSGSTAVFPDRTRRLGLLASGLRTRQTFPLLVACELPSPSFELLCGAVRQYISACLREAEVPHRAIGALPNLSPNGVLFPKREVLLEFNLVQRAMAQLFGSLGIDEFVDAIQLPVNVRLVDGRPDPVADVRPHASTKLHSDVW